MLTICAGEKDSCCMTCPGSWHDSCVAEGIFNKLEHSTLNSYSIVVNSAFPTDHDWIAGKILVLFKSNQELP